MQTPRVRFAPSPTGHLHVGGARTALFNFLFARNQSGVFLLRIEDTDEERSTPEMTRAILSALEWLRLEPDEGPLHQADGVERHRRDAGRLLESGRAFRCFCGVGDDAEARATADGLAAAHRCDCRDLPEERAAARAAEGEPHVLRFRVPSGGRTEWDDAVHGQSGVDHDAMEDFALLRSDGSPVYNLACVSDDLEMEITHVIRGDDHLSNTPKQLLIYEALGARPPTFAHVPMILGPDGKRLSKRHGAVSVEAYRDEGIVPEAMVNFLALLGWSPGDNREVMDLGELIRAFSLSRILTKSATLDVEKLQWLNGQYLSRLPTGRLVELVVPRLEGEEQVEPSALEGDRERLQRVLDTVKPRARTVHELAEQVRPFFAEEISYQEEAVARFWKDDQRAIRALDAMREVLEGVEPWEPDAVEEALRARADELDVGAGKLIHPLRVALTGLAVSPGIFTVIHLMGRERCLSRIDSALSRLRQETTAG